MPAAHYFGEICSIFTSYDKKQDTQKVTVKCDGHIALGPAISVLTNLSNYKLGDAHSGYTCTRKRKGIFFVKMLVYLLRMWENDPVTLTAKILLFPEGLSKSTFFCSHIKDPSELAQSQKCLPSD